MLDLFGLSLEVNVCFSGLTLDNIMGFCTVALQHTAGEVREVSERIIKQLYRDVGAPVKSYLPVDDEKTRKNTLWRMLFEYFDKVDGKPSKADIKVCSDFSVISHCSCGQTNFFCNLAKFQQHSKIT